MRLIWARHGENTANLTRTFSYRVFDGDLTELGRRQAHALGRQLSQTANRPRFIVHSPLRRATQTAEILATYLGIEPELVLDDLRELNVGELDGRNDTQAWGAYTTVLDAWRHGDPQVRFPGGENLYELVDRLRRALTRTLAAAGEAPPLVLAHGANLRAAVPLLTGSPEPVVDLATGDVATLSVDPAADLIQLLTWGSTPPERPTSSRA